MNSTYYLDLRNTNPMGVFHVETDVVYTCRRCKQDIDPNDLYITEIQRSLLIGMGKWAVTPGTFHRTCADQWLEEYLNRQ